MDAADAVPRIVRRMGFGYPLMLDVSNRLIVIVGGGAVAARKARGLLDSGAKRVRVVSPKFDDAMPAEVERVIEKYRPEHLAGAALVFATTDDPTVNEAVVRDARAANVLVCRADADDENAGDFATPALLRDGAIAIAISSGGNPALAAAVRDRLRDKLDPRWKKMADAMQTIRPKLRSAAKVSPAQRRELFRALATDEAMDVLDQRGLPGLLEWIERRALD